MCGHACGRLVESRDVSYNIGFLLGLLFSVAGLLLCWTVVQRKGSEPYHGKHRRVPAGQAKCSILALEETGVFSEVFELPEAPGLAAEPPEHPAPVAPSLTPGATCPPEPYRGLRMACSRCGSRWNDDYFYCGDCGAETVVAPL